MQKTKYCLDLEGQLVHCERGMHSVLSPNSNDTLSAFSFFVSFYTQENDSCKIYQGDRKRSSFVWIFPTEQKFRSLILETNTILNMQAFLNVGST